MSSASKIKRQEMLTNGAVGPTIIRFAIPCIVSSLITTVYHITDTFFVSSLGTNATAAISVNTSLDMVVMMAGSFLATGASSFISRLLGAGEKRKADFVMSSSFFLAVLFGLFVLVLGTVFIKPLVQLLGATATCEKYSIDYARFILLAAPFMTSCFVMNQTLRSEGSATLAMVGMGVGGILNCVLDPIMIFYFNMEVAGASLATCISKIVSFLILIIPYISKHSIVRLSIRYFSLRRSILLPVFSVGSTALFRTGMAIVSGILLNNIAGDISDSALAALGVAKKIMEFPFCFIMGLGMGFTPVAGFNYGAKNYERVKECFRFASFTAIGSSVVLGALLWAYARPLFILFAGTDTDMLNIGLLSIISQCIVLPVHAWVAIVNMLFAGIGDAKNALLLSTSRQGTCFIPTLFILSALWGVNGIAMTQAAADLLSLVIAIPCTLALYRKYVKHAEAVK